MVEVPGGYAVKDIRTNEIWTKTYATLNGAVAKAVKLNEAHANRRYF